MAHYVQVQHDAGGGGASQTKKSEPSAKEAAQELIAQVCKSMALPDEVALAAQDRCVDVHLKAARNVPFGARGAKEAFALACILQSCRALNVPRTLNDILGQRACQCPGKKMLGKWLKCVQSTLGEELRPVDASQLLSRYCEILEVSEEPAMRELQRTLLTGVLDGRTENVKAAAAVVRACGVNSEAVADAAGVSKGSLDSALRLWPTSWEKKDAAAGPGVAERSEKARREPAAEGAAQRDGEGLGGRLRLGNTHQAEQTGTTATTPTASNDVNDNEQYQATTRRRTSLSSPVLFTRRPAQSVQLRLSDDTISAEPTRR
eukprot:278074-Rhodomonas_salina.1